MKKTATDHEIMEQVLGEFEQLAAIPRQSGHEEQVSAYLFRRAKGLGLCAVQDEAHNVITEKAAAPGHERAPMTILQAHMDMVCVGAEGKKYDPLTDGIELVRDADSLWASGTSLGADDGMGIAIIFHLLQAEFPHGPLRVIFTADEENGMSGAIALAARHLDGKYLINCDSEDFDILTVSSAGSVGIDFIRKPSWRQPTHHHAYTLTVKGLRGGHSGLEINCGRANAIHILACTLDQMQAAGVPFELAEIHGGTARNAIPSRASGILVIEADALPSAERAIAAMNAHMKAVYGVIEANYAIVLSPAALPEQVMSDMDCAQLLNLLCLMQIGVSSMSQAVSGLVETSANLGMVATAADALSVNLFPRSAQDALVDEIKRKNQKLADLCGFSTSFSAQSPGWPQNPQSKLARIFVDRFAHQNQRQMKLDCIHAGLECSYFYQKNPALDIVSVGSTITDIHSPQEKADLRTIAPHVRLLMEILTCMALDGRSDRA